MNDTPDTAAPIIHSDAEPAITHLPPSTAKFRPESAEDPRDLSEREAAFDAAFQWAGKELHGFTSSRSNLFAQHRLAIGAPSLGACLDDVEAFEADAARILWLCSHTPADWSQLRVAPPALQCAIDNWADKAIPPHKGLEASVLAMKIWNASRRNDHETAPSGKEHGDDSGN